MDDAQLLSDLLGRMNALQYAHFRASVAEFVARNVEFLASREQKTEVRPTCLDASRWPCACAESRARDRDRSWAADPMIAATPATPVAAEWNAAAWAAPSAGMLASTTAFRPAQPVPRTECRLQSAGLGRLRPPPAAACGGLGSQPRRRNAMWSADAAATRDVAV